VPGTKMTLTGWKAALALALLVGVGVFRIETARTRLDTQGRAALETWVQDEMIRPILADTTRSLADRGAAAVGASSIRIRSLAVRGPLSNAVVRVELAPNPALPPGTRRLRYYRVRYTQILGWRERGTATKMDWYLAAF